MRLTYISNIRLPNQKAHSIQIVKMSEAFYSYLGDDFKLLLPSMRPGVEYTISIREYYGLKRDLPIKRLPVVDAFDFERFLPKPLKILPNLIEFISFSWSSLIFIISHPEDIYYTRSLYLSWIMVLFGRKVFVEIHEFPASKIGQAVQRLIVPNLTGIVCISRGFLKFYKKYRMSFRKILVAPNASDLTFFTNSKRSIVNTLKKEYGLSQTAVVIGYIGRLTAGGVDKGRNTLLNCFSKLVHVSLGIKFLIVGEKKKPSEEINNKITFAGYVTYVQMPEYFSLLDVGVIPFPDQPHFRYFMSPLKLFDYLAAGKPIITSDLPTTREILAEENAIFVPPENPDKLAQAILKLSKNRKMLKKMSAANLALAKKYTWSHRAKKILDFMEISYESNILP